MVKRRLFLLFFTILLIFSAYFAPSIYHWFSSVTANLVLPTSYSVYDRIPLSGQIIAKNSSDLTTKLPLVASRVMVKTGDTVQAGDIVASIDQKQTLRAITAMLTTYQTLADLPIDLSTFADAKKYSSFDDLTHAIPQTLTAPASGTVLSCIMQKNTILPPGVSLLTVADCDTLSVSLNVDEKNAERLQTGQTVSLRCHADDKHTFTAKITDIAPAASQVISGTSVKTIVEVTADLTEKNDFKPGYTVYGYRFSDTPTEYLLIPLSCVYQQDQQEYVYLWQDGKACKHPITTDGVYAQNAIVTAGLSEKDQVIISETEPYEHAHIRFQPKEDADD